MKTYEVTLRRDVQQVARVRVEASSRQEAFDIAESIVDDAAWTTEKSIGTHLAQVQLQSSTPIKGRETDKADRRAHTDRRASKRRLGDKSRALVAARNTKKKGS